MHQTVKIYIICVVICFARSKPTSFVDSNDVQLESGEDDTNSSLDRLGSSVHFESYEMNVDEVEGNIRYTFGKRVKNDRLVSQHTDESFWTTPQNVTLILQYPGSGKGQSAILSYVEIIVNQSSNIGKAKVIAGGIGKRYIASIVEANSTYWFNYSANIYGIS